MGMKKRIQSKAKKGPRASLTKLSNKRLNKLAKQGKLKKRIKKTKLKQLLEERTGAQENGDFANEDNGMQSHNDEEIPLDDVDFEYFSKPGQDLSFLSTFGDKDECRSKRKRKNRDVDEEAEFEQIPRKRAQPTDADNANMKPLLPIKSKRGGVIPQMVEMPEGDDSASDDDAADDTEDAAIAEPLPALTLTELIQQRRQKLADKKAQIALLASAVVQNPDENTRKLKELRLMLRETDPDVSITVKKLALVTLTEVFKDIIPGYRIRELSDTEKLQSAKKETKKMWDFEQSLITNYKHYLEFAEIVITGKSLMKKKKKQRNGNLMNKEGTTVMRQIATRCLCDMLVTHPHFNFRNNIIAVIIPLMDHRDAQISDTICNCVRRVYKEDKSGEVPLEIVKLCSRMIKARKFNVQPKVLNTFLSLKLQNASFDTGAVDEKKMSHKEKMKKMSRRDRKRHKEMNNLEKELQEASGTEDRVKMKRRHTEIVEIVFLTYFRILKTAPHSVLLSSVLEGLAKFAHLISIDFFDDLFSVINQLIESGNLSHRESLFCVQTAFTILTGEGAALNIDPMRFYKHCYNTLFKLHAGSSNEDLGIALECLHLMFNKRKKHISQQRLLAFIKRLSTLSLQLLSHSCLGTLAALRSFLHIDSKTDVLFEAESHGSGMFQPELPDPEHCNAYNTALFELHTLRRHYHPVVCRYADHLCAGAPSRGNHQLSVDLATVDPVSLFEKFNSGNMDFNPSIPKKSPRLKRLPTKIPGSFFQSDFETFVSKAIHMKDIQKLTRNAFPIIDT